MRRLVIVVALAVATASAACLSTQTTPAGPSRTTLARWQQQLWHREQVKANLERLRDAAYSANKRDPPLISDEVAVQVLLFEKTALGIVMDGPFGWQKAVKTLLEQLRQWLAVNDRLLLDPYMDLVKSAVEESEPRDPGRGPER